MVSLVQRWRGWREARALARRAIPDDLWRLTLARWPFLVQRSREDLAELRRLASLFLDDKAFHGAGGLTVDDSMAVGIAAQACLPLLHLPAGLALYNGFVGIVVHPDEVVAQREVMGEDGVVHRYSEVLAGEAMEGGPVMLSWHDVNMAGEAADAGYNVVVHEFAHVLDMAAGEADGVPPQASAADRNDWITTLDAAYEHFCHDVDAGHDTLLDPYGATHVSEYFAVATESFFVSPKALRAEHPALYGLLARYFQQDPATFGEA